MGFTIYRLVIGAALATVFVLTVLAYARFSPKAIDEDPHIKVPARWLRGVTSGPTGGDCNDAARGVSCMSTVLNRGDATQSLPVRIGRHRNAGGSVGSGATRKVRQIAGDNRFFRLEVHSVSVEGGGVIDDWMYCEVPDMINVLVEDAESRQFVVFRQSKYAIPGETLALLGGYIEPNESPLEAAQREVLEELRMKCAEFVPLAQGVGFRTDANRGFGVYYPFLARSCHGTTSFKSSDDLEGQKEEHLSLEQLRTHLLAGRFRELKWTNTIALALLHLQAQRPS